MANEVVNELPKDDSHLLQRQKRLFFFEVSPVKFRPLCEAKKSL
jgi:hypothetical protein